MDIRIQRQIFSAKQISNSQLLQISSKIQHNTTLERCQEAKIKTYVCIYEAAGPLSSRNEPTDRQALHHPSREQATLRRSPDSTGTSLLRSNLRAISATSTNTISQDSRASGTGSATTSSGATEARTPASTLRDEIVVQLEQLLGLDADALERAFERETAGDGLAAADG